MDNKSLARLVERANKQDIDAFAQIYSELYESVYYIGLKITGKEQDAGDVVQETMVHIYQNLHKLKDAKYFTAFVNRTATNCSIDVLRSRKKEFIVESDNALFEDASKLHEEFIPQEYVEKEELRKQVVEAVEGLNEEQKSIVLLFYYKGLSVKEIAKQLDISRSLVKTRLFRARSKLKQQLEQKERLEEVKGLMTIPALSKILQMDADASCSSKLCEQHWLRLAENLGFSEEAATAALTNATSGTAVLENIHISNTAWKIAGVAALSAAVCAGIMLATQTVETSNDTWSSQAQPAAAPNAIYFSGHDAFAEMDILPPDEAIINEQIQQHPPDVSKKEEPVSAFGAEATTSAPPSGNSNSSKEAREAGGAASIYTEERLSGQSGEGDSAASGTIPGKVENQDEKEGGSMATQILVKNRVLEYPQYHPLTGQQLVEDAGVAVPQGMSAKADSSSIDTGVCNSYGAYILILDEGDEVFYRIAIVVKIVVVQLESDAIDDK